MDLKLTNENGSVKLVLVGSVKEKFREDSLKIMHYIDRVVSVINSGS